MGRVNITNDNDEEIISGLYYSLTPPLTVTHQIVNKKIVIQLLKELDTLPNAKALSHIDWDISNDTVVKPDTLVICYEPNEKITKKPKLIFEIASKSTIKRDETLKYELYQQEGVAFYVIVYPKKQVAKVYKLKDGRYIKAGDFSDENYEFELNKCSINFDFSKIWRKK